MIIYLILKLMLFLFNIISGVLGDLIPSFPTEITSLFETISSIVNGGFSFISYFSYWNIIIILINLLVVIEVFDRVKKSIFVILGKLLNIH